MATRFTLSFLILVAISNGSLAQTLARGIVVDSATFAALPHVNVTVKNTLRGTSTDLNGNFSIAAKPNDTLVFSLLGYRRLEFPLSGYEPGLIRLTERPQLLPAIEILDQKIYVNPYEGMFDEENQKLIKKIPFYYSRQRKDKIKAANWREDVARVQTYVDVVINDSTTRANLMKDFSLSEKEYYETLTKFNERHYEVMYYLTAGELLSLLQKFFEANVATK
ncbi:MAG TPA: carboxypeptidase-like regulatory domain-containing protein [Chryseosolibacter sp.]|nr:carboxypeptidase-like regulatory domain-containing protein [Chryseosolibacter sp.]